LLGSKGCFRADSKIRSTNDIVAVWLRSAVSFVVRKHIDDASLLVLEGCVHKIADGELLDDVVETMTLVIT